MGVGDRHSKRAVVAGGRPQAVPVPAPVIEAGRRAPPADAIAAHVPDDSELDEAFSAWDDDDALARRPALPSAARGTPSMLAETRVGRRPAGSAAPATDPGGGDRRAPPLAELAARLIDPVSAHDIVLSRARTIDDPLTTRVLAEIARADAMSERAGPAVAPAAAPIDPAAPAQQPAPPAAAVPIAIGRRTTRRSVPHVRDEPLRKK
jgi:hypothetical protein